MPPFVTPSLRIIRQLCSGFFLDILFDCPYEMHELTADKFIFDMVRDLSEEHKEVLYFLSLQHLQEKQAAGGSLALREQEFFRVFGELLQTMGKNAVIRPKNKTPSRKKKAALDAAKDG